MNLGLKGEFAIFPLEHKYLHFANSSTVETIGNILKCVIFRNRLILLMNHLTKFDDR